MIGARTAITNINPPDGSAEAAACATFYTPVIQSLLRAAHWNCARKQVAASQLKTLFVNGVLQTGTAAPPTPWWYEYAVPSDCLKVRFILNLTPQSQISPPLTSGSGQYPVPQTLAGFSRFTPALDTDANNNPVKVILTNQNQAQLVYTADISQVPDLWDSQLHIAASSSLASYLVNPLARNAALLRDLVTSASGAIAAARATDGNESLPSQDNFPDWVRIRMSGGSGGLGAPTSFCANWDVMSFPGGLSY